MTELKPGTVIGTLPCYECGAPVPVKLGRERTRARPKAFVDHRKPSPAHPAYDGCGFRGYFSREKSDEFIEAYQRGLSPGDGGTGERPAEHRDRDAGGTAEPVDAGVADPAPPGDRPAKRRRGEFWLDL